MDTKTIIKRLKSLSNPVNVEGMARFGISPDKTFGIQIPVLRKMAKEAGKNHKLALELWETGYHEARILASMVDNPKEVTSAQMDKWAGDFDSWDVCDQCCSNLFDKTMFAYGKVFEWSKRKEEYVKRAAFSLIAVLSVHDKDAGDDKYIKLFPLIIKASTDERNFVKKAVNWALRQIGKRNMKLNKEAIKIAKEINNMDSRTAKWIATDALRELENPKILSRMKH